MIPLTVDREGVLRYLAISPAQVRDMVDEIRVWMKTQPHLIDLEDDRIEGLLRSSKFNVQKAKLKIEVFETMRGQVPEIFHTRDPVNDPEMLKTYNYAGVAIMDGYTTNYERVTIIKFYTNDLTNYSCAGIIKLFVSCLDLRLFEDYNHADILVLDMENIYPSQVLSANPFLIRKVSATVFDGYGFKMNGYHIVNSSKAVTYLLKFLKLILKPKLYERIRVHDDYESLYNYVPKSLLPEDYGGTQPPIKSIAGRWVDELKSRRDFFEAEKSVHSDESKRKPSNSKRFFII